MQNIGRVGAGAGSAETLIVFTDVSSVPCVLSGTPIVHFLGTDGQVLGNVATTDRPSGMFPVWPNDGVGLIPMTGSPPRGVRGQAGLPLQWTSLMCATQIAGIAVTLPTGTLRTPILTGDMTGSDGSDCLPPNIVVNPFEPAEAYR
ncbi:MAG: DUF4232 domain-containing protein [Candidatus Dormibacteraeota bacterium]|nr:DUF4232 domain-containing protein [Candidatus Dormibacteraeota bacterium]